MITVMHETRKPGLWESLATDVSIGAMCALISTGANE